MYIFTSNLVVYVFSLTDERKGPSEGNSHNLSQTHLVRSSKWHFQKIPFLFHWLSIESWQVRYLNIYTVEVSIYMKKLNLSVTISPLRWKKSSFALGGDDLGDSQRKGTSQKRQMCQMCVMGLEPLWELFMQRSTGKASRSGTGREDAFVLSGSVPVH